MLFNSLEFLLCFPVVVGLYFALPHRWRWLHLLLASYVFYASFVFFRSPDLSTALHMYGQVATGRGLAFVGDAGLLVFALLLIPATELIEFRQRHLDRWQAPTALRWAGDWALLVATLLFGVFTREAFVYFQF